MITDNDVSKLKKTFATKNDYQLEFKKQLKPYATKADVKEIVDEAVSGLAKIIADTIAAPLNNHEICIRALENKNILPS